MKSMTRRLPLLICFVLVIAFALRLIQLGERNFWYDEAFSALFAGQDIPTLIEGTLAPADGGAAEIHPLLYYLTLNGWLHLLGESAFTVRLLSAVFGTLTVGVIYLIGSAAFDPRTGIIAALITAVAPFHVQYSQEARMYALMGLCLALATWTFLQAYRAEKRAWRWWAAFGVFAGLSMHAQQLSAFYLVALGLIPVFARRRDAVLGVSLGAGIALVLYGAWLFVLPGQLARVTNGYWIDVPTPARILLTLRSFVMAALDIPPPQGLIGLAIMLILLIFLLLQIFVMRRRRSAREQGSILIILWLFAAPIGLLWLFSQFRPLYLDRGLIGCSLMFYVALGWLFTRGGLPRPFVAALSGLFLIAAAIGLTAHYNWSAFPNSPYRQAMEIIASRMQPGDVIVHQDKTSALPSIFYAPNLNQHYLRDEPGARDDTLSVPAQQALGALADDCIQTAASGANRVWWVMFTFAPGQYAAAGVTTLETQIAWLNAHYTAAETVTLRDLAITLYTALPGDTQGECPA